MVEVVGIERIKEALEANDWAAADDIGAEEALAELDINDGDFNNSFAAEEAEINMEFMGMKTAVNAEERRDSTGFEDDEAGQVEELERMIPRLQEIKGLFAVPVHTETPLTAPRR